MSREAVERFRIALERWRQERIAKDQTILDQQRTIDELSEEISALRRRIEELTAAIEERTEPASSAEKGELKAEIARLADADAKRRHSIEQTLGKALGYPRVPQGEATDGGLVSIGNHSTESLVAEAAAMIVRWKVGQDRAQATALAEALGNLLRLKGAADAGAASPEHREEFNRAWLAAQAAFVSSKGDLSEKQQGP